MCRPPRLVLALSLALPLLAAGPAGADRVRGPAPAIPAACSDRTPVGEVASLSGSAWAETPDSERRLLACGDTVRACERIEAGDDAQVGVVTPDGVWAQLEGPGAFQVTRTDAGAPAFDVEVGALRVVDTREAPAAPLRLAGPGVVAEGSGGDGSLRVSRGAGAPEVALCTHGGSFDVARDGGREHTVAEAGRCLEARGRAPLRAAAEGAAPVALTGRDLCVQPVAISDRFDPNQVAAAPPPSGLLSPAPPAFERYPCDLFGCGRGNLGVIESPTTPGELPGGVQPGGLPD